MKLSLRRTSTADSADVEADIPNATARSLAEADYVSVAITVVIVACLLAGPAGLAIAYLSASAPAPAAAAAPDPSVDVERQQAGEYATQVVVAWLGATQEDSAALTRLVPAASSVRPGQEPIEATDARVASVAAADDSWSVSVAATVAGERRYFQVPVAVDESGAPSALTLPTPSWQVRSSPSSASTSPASPRPTSSRHRGRPS